MAVGTAWRAGLSDSDPPTCLPALLCSGNGSPFSCPVSGCLSRPIHVGIESETSKLRAPTDDSYTGKILLCLLKKCKGLLGLHEFRRNHVRIL